MVSASIKVAGVGWQSCGASGGMSGKQTFAERTGQPRCSPVPAVPPGWQHPPGQNPDTHGKSEHRGLEITCDVCEMWMFRAYVYALLPLTA